MTFEQAVWMTLVCIFADQFLSLRVYRTLLLKGTQAL